MIMMAVVLAVLLGSMAFAKRKGGQDA